VEALVLPIGGRHSLVDSARALAKVGRLTLKLIVRMRRAFLQGGVSASDGLMNREEIHVKDDHVR